MSLQASRGQKPDTQETVELDYVNVGELDYVNPSVPAAEGRTSEEEGAQAADERLQGAVYTRSL